MKAESRSLNGQCDQFSSLAEGFFASMGNSAWAAQRLAFATLTLLSSCRPE